MVFPFQMQHQFLEAVPVHSGGPREDLLPTVADTTRVKRIFRHIDANIGAPYEPPLYKNRKAGMRLRPSLHGHQGSLMAQSTYQGSEEAGTD